ncbi:MAG: glycosyltransferase [Planctomyces sp.]|nr:glycosyltransferase [Planctomyces sp.]
MNAHTPPRILMVITELDRGGAEQQFVQLALGLQERGWKVRAVCLGPRAELCVPLETTGIEVAWLDARGLLSAGRVLWRLRRHILEFRPDLVQTFLFHANILGRLAARWAGVRKIVCGLRVAEKRAHWHGTIEWLTASLVTCWVCVSEGVRSHARDVWRLPADRLVVIPNGLDVSKWRSVTPIDRASLRIPANAEVLLSVGRLDYQKGIDLLLQAFATVSRERPLARLVIAGEGPLRPQLESLANGLPHGADRVHFLGQRADIPALLAMCDLFVLASRWEGMPNALMEAMAAGKPCVATRVEGIPELLRQGEAGWLVDGENETALAATIQAALSDPTARQAFGRAAQEISVKDFTADSMIDRYAQLYAELESR